MRSPRAAPEQMHSSAIADIRSRSPALSFVFTAFVFTAFVFPRHRRPRVPRQTRLAPVGHLAQPLYRRFIAVFDESKNCTPRPTMRSSPLANKLEQIMDWRGRRRSSNIEDRRGQTTSRGRGGVRMGGGIGGIGLILLVVVFLTGGNPLSLLDGMMGEQQQVDPRSCLLYTSPSPRDATLSRMPSSA